MGTYQELEKDIFSIFGSPAWVLEGIKTFPSDFVTSGTSGEFLRVSILSSSKGLNLNSKSGIIIIEIFVSAGSGPNRTSVIADKLDEYLKGETVKTNTGAVTQFGQSTLVPNGNDREIFFKSSYTIPFNYFGVF
jgi:hypothetical protein